MSDIILKQAAIEELMGRPAIQQWLRDKQAAKVPLLRYYRRSYSTLHDGSVLEHGDGFTLTSIDPNSPTETKDIVVRSVLVTNDFNILVGGKPSMMSRDFSIGWSKKFTYEH